MRISIVTGRDAGLVKDRVDLLCNKGIRVLEHPFTTIHPADGARALRDILDGLEEDGWHHLAIVTFQEWIIQKLSEWVGMGRLSPEDVAIYVEESGVGGPFSFDERGVLGDGWPFGYFHAGV